MRKKLLSAFLTMCMMLTMLPMSALAAEKTKDTVKLTELTWTDKDGVNTYDLSDDTQITEIKANEGDYKINLDTKALYVASIDVAAGSSLEIVADKTSEKGVYGISSDSDITFTLGGNVKIDQYVIFNDAVVVKAGKAPRSRALSENTFSGKYTEGLKIESGVTATLESAEVKGGVSVAEGTVLTVAGDTKITDGTIKGAIVVKDGATLTLASDVTLAEGSEIKVAGTLNTKGATVNGAVTTEGNKATINTTTETDSDKIVNYSYDVSENGFMNVYEVAEDSKTTLVATANTGKGTIVLAKDTETKLWFAPDIGYKAAVKIDDKDVDLDNNTYTLAADTDKKIVADFSRTGSSGGGGGGSSGYSVNVASTTNGTVTVSPKNAAKGATVTVTVKPDKGYVLDTLTVTDKDGKKIDLTDKGDNKYTFVMPAGSVTVKATFKVAPKTPFTDVAESAWYADAVAYVFENGMMKGTSDTKFSPEQTTTRGMIVTILYRLEKEPSASASSFTDVAAGKYYSKAVAWASANKIVTGYGDGKFGPDDTITREQMAAILYRYASYKGYDVTKTADLSKFTDASQVGVFAKAAMQWANAEGLINGTSTTKLSPKSGATRAEVATILMRFCENIAK